MTAEVFDLGSVFCPPASCKVEESSDTNIYDMWFGHTAGVDVGSYAAPALPLVATTITLEAIQNILWANGFPIEPPPTSDVGPGPFEDTQFDVVVDVETTDDMEDDKKSVGNNSSLYESDLSEEDLSVLPDIPLSPTPSVMSDSDFDFSSCDSGIEAEFDELHDGEGDKDQKNKESNNDNSSNNKTEVKQENGTTEGCHSCLQNRSNNSNGTRVKTEGVNIKKENNKEKDSEENLDFHCQYLWEFLQHLLADSKYHNCIVWKNERRGIFRLTDHQRVADLWGKHKKRQNMTYDKLSRALRYYYSRNILKKVDGQRLTYKFCKNLDGKKFAS